MYLIVIAWIYVVLLMSVAEATNSTGTVLGALVTFVLYGVGPAALVVYLMGTPARNKAVKKREAEERVRSMTAAASHAEAAQENAAPASPSIPSSPSLPSHPPDAGGHAAGGAETIGASAAASIAPVGKEP